MSNPGDRVNFHFGFEHFNFVFFFFFIVKDGKAVTEFTVVSVPRTRVAKSVDIRGEKSFLVKRAREQNGSETDMLTFAFFLCNKRAIERNRFLLVLNWNGWNTLHI